MKSILITFLFIVSFLSTSAQSATFYVELVGISYDYYDDRVPGDGECRTQAISNYRLIGTPQAEGICTLRAAVQEANALPGPDDIILPAGFFTSATGAHDDENNGGDYDIHSEITITGQGRELFNEAGTDWHPESSIVSAYRDRAFDVHSGGKLTLNRLIAFGVEKDRYGRFVIGGGAPSTTLPDNRNVSLGDAQGGILRVIDGELILNDVSVGGANIDGNGGGISADRSTLEINNSAVYWNRLKTGQLNGGGGAAGGILLIESPAIIRGSIISDNPPPNETGSAITGGAILSSSNLVIEGTTFSNNSAKYGGAIWHAVGRITITNSTFLNNRAGVNGGAIWLNRGDINFSSTATHIPPYIINSTFEDNTARGAGNSESTDEWLVDLGPRTFISDSGREISLMEELSGQVMMQQEIGNVGGGAIFISGQEGYANLIPIVNNLFINNSGVVVDGYPGGSGDCWVSEHSSIVSMGGNIGSDDSCGFESVVQGKASRKAADRYIQEKAVPQSVVFQKAEASRAVIQKALNGFIDPVSTRSDGVDTSLEQFAITAGSKAHNQAVQEYCPETDQRGFKRDAQCDIGAYELLPPGAFDAPFIARSGNNLEGHLQVESRGSKALTYKIIEAAKQGDVLIAADGSFVYTANSDASESDSFSYRVCNETGACSEIATVSYNFVEPKDLPISVEVIENSIAEVSAIDVVDEHELKGIKEDFSHDYPLGVFFFNVSKIETNEKQQVVVRLQLPNNEVIPAESVIRQMDKEGNWITLSSTPSAVASFATVNRDTNTLTLTLVDNDSFDSNPEKGAIRNPVGLAVPAAHKGTNLGATGTTGWLFMITSMLFLLISRGVLQKR